MTRELCAQFIRETTNGECSVDDPRIGKVFETYDQDKDDILNEDNFV